MESDAAEKNPVEFANETVKVKAHFKGSCKVELEVETAASLVHTARQEAAKVVSKEVVIPGFRKGKAPLELVEKKYSGHVTKETEKAIADAALRASMGLCNIPLLNGEMKATYAVKSFSDEDGAKLSLFFETEPTIPLIDPKAVVLKRVERPEVNAEKVEETVRQVRLFFAKWTPVTDRGVQEGDFVIMDVDVIEELPAHNLFSKTRFEVTEKSMAKWMRDLVVGKNKGAVLEGVSVPDADAKASDTEGLGPKKVRLTIHEVETAEMPEVTEEFAQRMGAATVADMYANIERILHEKADAHVRDKQREEVSKILVEKYPFDVPLSIIEKEVRFRMQHLVQDPEYLQHWQRMTDEAKRRVIESVSEQASKAVRIFYLCHKLVDEHKISISPDDIPKPSYTPLHMLLGERREENPQGSSEIQQAEAYSRLLLEKTEDFIIAQATLAE